ncbi:uncharacterized protein [Clytia hemisphaerica]|uniref:Uncharacterized protein n=1 Tax=Clytia hemisphaerica TaxID=252671 RepID=A0A7M5WSC0_9CNID|eukprot:TCONS_00068708-protein
MKKLDENCFRIIRQLINEGKASHLFKYNENAQKELSLDDVKLPNIWFWDPLENTELVLYCPLCDQDKKPGIRLSSTSRWETGKSTSSIPRTIWDSNWYVALVGKQYRCECDHIITSYHAGILRQLEQFQKPFFLSHDSGLTKAAFDLISRLIDHGNSFATAQRIFTEGIVDQFYRRSFMHFRDLNNLPAIEEIIPKPPSEKFLRNCFVLNYHNYSEVYKSLMASLTSEYISCDHTFKSASNIGYTKDGKWIKLVDSIFLTMNEFGQVTSYQLCNGPSFKEVENLFKNLSEKKETIIFIYVDNCCQWKNKILEYFPDAIIKLDLFHGLQRLVITIKKRHPFHAEICRLLTLVFRATDDIGEERTMATPAPDVILSNMENFIFNWKDVAFKGWKVLQKPFFDAWELLKQHVNKGCLSNIPVGHGTNRNENLHRQMNKILPRNRLGIETAHALLNSVFYYQNAKKKDEKYVLPIWTRGKPIQNPNISAEQCNENVELADDDIPFLVDTDVTNDDHSYLTGGRGWKTRTIISIANQFKEVNSKMDGDILNRLFGPKGFTSLPLDVWKIDEYLESSHSGNESFPISGVLKALSLTEIKYSGNFIFSFARQIVDLLKDKNLTPNYKNFLNSIGINEKSSIEKVSTILENIVSEELKFNFENYGFPETSTFDPTPTSHVLQCLVNSLGVMMVLIPSRVGMPFYPLVPGQGVAVNQVFYVWCCPEADKFTCLVSIKTMNIPTSCRCGRRGNNDDMFCVREERCSCLKRGVKCNSDCFCRNCQNHRPESIVIRRRKRIQPELNQRKPLTSYSAAIGSQQQEIPNPLTSNQSLLLESILFLLLRDMNTTLLEIEEDLIVEQLSLEYIQLVKEFSRDGTLKDYIIKDYKQLIVKWVKYRKFRVHLESQKKNATVSV